jgi:hypothetical protein
VNGCSTTSDTTNITSLTGVKQLTANSGQLTVYPNPFTNEVFAKINSSAEDVKDWSLQITDVLGRTVYIMSPLNLPPILSEYMPGTFNIDLANLPDGVYFIAVINQAGRVVVPVVKE